MIEQLLKSNLQNTGPYSGTLDLLNQDYPSKSIDQNKSKLVNMYLSQDQFKGAYSLVAFPTPGLELFCDTTQSNVRALLEQNEVTYAVAGNKFYSINSDGVETELGTLNTSSGFCKMKSITGATDNNNQIVIIDGTNGYYYNIGTATGQFPITDEDFPQDAQDLAATDDYFILMHADSISFSISGLADGTSYSALDFASKTGQPDRLVAICESLRRLYLMGSKTIEPYYNSGDPDFPFERVQEAFMEMGVAAKRSVAKNGDNIIFLAKTAQGGYKVMKIQGYQSAAISDEVSDAQIRSLTRVHDAYGYCYTFDGHDFYDLTFPTDNITLTFDLTTGIKLEKQSYISSAYGKFLGACSTFCYGKSLIGDSNSGKIYSLSSAYYTENTTPIRRIFDTPHVYAGGRKIFIRRLMIDVENDVGDNKTFTLEKSYDSGRTWQSVKTFTIGSDNNTRLFVNNLGSSRKWTFRISTTMDAKFMILGFQAEAELGVH